MTQVGRGGLLDAIHDKKPSPRKGGLGFYQRIAEV